MKGKTIIKIAGLLVILLGVLFVLPTAALAESGGGKGTLTAQGDGLAGVRGNGEISITGNGVLWIKDYAGDAEIEISGSGVRRELPGGWIRYTGFSGEVHAQGSRVTVVLSGYDIDLTATGEGKFVLRGHGSYQTGSTSGEWTSGFSVMSYP